MPVMDDSFQAFVTNLGKYNEGELVGEWVKFPTTEEEMQKVFERIGIGSKDEFGHVFRLMSMWMRKALFIHASSAGRTDSSSRSTKSCISAAQPQKKWEAAVFATPY